MPRLVSTLIPQQAVHNTLRLTAQVHQQEVGLTHNTTIFIHVTDLVSISDPVEAEAVSSAFFDGNQSGSKPETSVDPLYVGSIKTVLGHTEG